MDYRHEWKIEINFSDLLVLRQRLRAIAAPDPHAIDGKYHIRSLYFDTPTDKALREKIDGVDRREKFRIRCYNGNTSLIHLEKKCKIQGLCRKESCLLDASEVQSLLDGDDQWMKPCDRPLVQDLAYQMQTTGLRPKTLVDYTREPFVFAPGNVRVTLDYDIRTGLGTTDFLHCDCVTIPANPSPIILEVKWDEFLPDIIRDAVQLQSRRAGAFSKYAACRTYG